MDDRRRGIRKGLFMTSTPAPGSCVAKRQPLPPEFEHFEAAAARADEIAAMERRRAAEIVELARRLQKVRDDLAVYQKARKK
jgi:hypothetical protein